MSGLRDCRRSDTSAFDACFDETVDEMLEGALASGAPQLDGITRESLEKAGHLRLNLNGSGAYLPFANGFPTATWISPS